MSAHLSNEIVERFHDQALATGDRGVIYNHILACEACRRRVVTPQIEAVALRSLTDHLLPPDGEEPFHVDLETIEAFVDDTLDPLDRSTVKLHLEDCEECSAEVEDLRESLATMRAASRKILADQPHVEVVTNPRPNRFTLPVRIAAMVAVAALGTLMLFVLWRWKSSAPTELPGNTPDRTAESKPSPNSSPLIPSVVPSPAIVTPPKLAVNPPTKGLNEAPLPAVASLKDGAHEISIDQAGNVIGAPELAPDSQRAVKRALSGEPLTRPAVLDDVATADVSVRAPTGNEERIRIVSPTSAVIVQDKPTLRWAPSKNASAYRIEIADELFRRVAQSGDLAGTTQTWTPAAQLKRGEVFTWIVRAVSKEGEPSPLTSQAKFKVLSEDKMHELNQLKTRQSHLALGLFYAREGMTTDAEREFGILAQDNPNSPIAKKLLQEVRAWRKR